METHAGKRRRSKSRSGLNRTMQYGNLRFYTFFLPVRQFKSYYVVWKPVDFKTVQLRKNSLNRTMQYGNYLKEDTTFRISASLNRTMQYGNDFLYGVKTNHSICLNRTMQYGNLLILHAPPMRISLFKSYYVVWKPFSPSFNFFTVEGLNRTMQYGNFLLELYRRSFAEFKSYYVVWKPSLLIWSHSFRLCLNRTMQYGNYISSLEKDENNCV